MKRKTLIKIGAVVLCLAVVIAYLCWPRKSFDAPETVQTLDLTRTQNSEQYLAEETYADQMQQVVEPYLADLVTSGYCEGYDGNSLYYEQYLLPEAKAHIVVSHGYTDAAYKFHEIIYYFLQNGYSVSIMEHRGHGNSHRALDEIFKVTVDSFEEYTQDYRTFLEQIVEPVRKPQEKLFIYAHSMGGGIAALLMEEDSTLFDAAILTSPMMEIEFNGVPDHLAQLISGVANLFGQGEKYIVGSGDYNDTYDYEYSGTNSESRYAYIRQCQLDNITYQTSGGTFAWLKAAITAAKKIRAEADRYQTPTILFQAQDDTTVGADGQNEFASKAQNVQMIQVPNTKHNILFAGNEVLIPYMNTIFAFYEQFL